MQLDRRSNVRSCSVWWSRSLSSACFSQCSPGAARGGYRRP